jgi:hypothetical protein
LLAVLCILALASVVRTVAPDRAVVSL